MSLQQNSNQHIVLAQFQGLNEINSIQKNVYENNQLFLTEKILSQKMQQETMTLKQQWRQANKDLLREFKDIQRQIKKEVVSQWRQANKELMKEFKDIQRQAKKEVVSQWRESQKRLMREFKSMQKKVKSNKKNQVAIYVEPKLEVVSISKLDCDVEGFEEYALCYKSNTSKKLFVIKVFVEIQQPKQETQKIPLSIEYREPIKLDQFMEFEQIIQECCQDLNDSVFLSSICARKIENKTQKQKQKYLSDLRKFTMKMKRLGATPSYEGSKLASFNWKPLMSDKDEHQLKEYFQTIGFFTIYLKGVPGQEEQLQAIKEYAQNEVAEFLSSKLDKLVSQVQGISITYKLYLNEFLYTGETIHELMGKILRTFTKYCFDRDELASQRDIRKTKIDSASFQIQINAGLPDSILGDRILHQLSSNNWQIFNPSTTSHCVADSIACIQLYNSSQTISSAFGYIKRRGKYIAEQYDIKKGCSAERLREIAQQENIRVIINTKDAEERIDEDKPFLFVVDKSHCIACLPPSCERATQIMDLVKKFQREQQYEMSRWKPKNKIGVIIPCTYDFEWLRNFREENEKGEKIFDQLPYSYGLYTELCDQEIYFSHNRIENIQSIFADDLVKMCTKISSIFPGETQITLQIFAHNGFKADWPLIEKFLLNDTRFEDPGQCASGQATIVKSFKLKVSDIKFKLNFLDSLNHLKCSVEQMATRFNLPIHKAEVDHDKITIENYIQEIERQEIDKYQRLDCQVLFKAIMAYDAQIQNKYGFSILLNEINTAASLAQKIQFSHFYDTFGCKIYVPTQSQQSFAQLAYCGGANVVYCKGYQSGVLEIDINSSYPFSYAQELPVGPYYDVQINQQYNGQPLLHGIYKIIVISTPASIRFPILPLKKDGLLVFDKLFCECIHTTLIEIKRAHELGYKIHILEGVVSENMGKPFHNYAYSLYAERNLIKKNMKQFDEGTPQWHSLNAEQELSKLLLNSPYGKLGQKPQQEVSGYVTQNEDFILKLFQKGHLKSVEQLNDRYIMWSGTLEQSNNYNSRINFILASYITAFARLRLFEAFYAIIEEYPHAQICYADTDSVHVAGIKSFNKNGSFYKKYIQQNILGNFKVEDSCGCERPEGCYVTNKVYALRNPDDHSQEKVIAKGVPQFLISSDDRAQKRRDQYGLRKMCFDDMLDLAKGIKQYEFKLSQQYIHKNLLKKDGIDHIKFEKETTKNICGILNKGCIDESGIVYPNIHIGDVDIPQYIKMEQDYITYPNTEQICLQLGNDDFNQIANQYCILQNGNTRQYTVFFNNDAVKPFLDKYNKDHIFHQVFGSFIIPCFDIDAPLVFKDGELTTMSQSYLEASTKIQEVKSSLARMLNNSLNMTKQNEKQTKYSDEFEEEFNRGNMIHPDQFDVVDRSRKDKISFHIRLPGFVIERQKLFLLVNELAMKGDRFMPFAQSGIFNGNELLQCFDTCIYREKGSLRISNNDIYYKPGMKQLFVQLPPHLQQKVDKKKNQDKDKTTLSQSTEKAISEQVNDYLKEKGLDKQWKIRNLKVNKSCTIAVLDRLQKGSCKKMDCCKIVHSGSDNFLYIKLTAKTITHGCWKCK